MILISVTNTAPKLTGHGRDLLAEARDRFAGVYRCFSPSPREIRKATSTELKRLKSLGYVQ